VDQRERKGEAFRRWGKAEANVKKRTLIFSGRKQDGIKEKGHSN